MNELRTIMKMYTDRVSPIPSEDLDMLVAIVDYHEAEKGEKLQNAETVPKCFYFVKKGLLRQFYYKDGRDITESFACDGDVMVCSRSIFFRKTTSRIIEALEPTAYYQMSYVDLKTLLAHSRALDRLYCRALESALAALQTRMDNSRFESARERYIRFRAERPEVAKRASVCHIASYLEMAPESLSRIRHDL